MLEGKLKTYPCPAKILPATIRITFIGPKGLPKSLMSTMFRVRRRQVRAALLWLKAHNPLYANIMISEENLELLPEDGVLEELMATAKHSGDIEAVEKEHAGYVPKDAADKGSTLINLFNDVIHPNYSNRSCPGCFKCSRINRSRRGEQRMWKKEVHFHYEFHVIKVY